MNGGARPCENPTTNTAVLPLVYFFAQGMCLYLLRSGFSVGLRLAKTTEAWAKYGLCLSLLRSGLLSDLSAIAFKLADRELHERHGETVRCATAFCIARLTRLFAAF